ncbi:hypothetical protein ABT354_23000 [Streptomyces sp. NPDC000594]|uniref:hypothetical protein n=1 Tax=Streptomyces sp. NPDC000594 TaxID=3154261 RepID=UPI00331F6897
MLIRITPRRLGAAAALYAVFVGGWYLGQPLPDVGCETSDPATVEPYPASVGEPGAVSDEFSRVGETIEDALTVELFATTAVLPCNPSEPHPRLVAWVIGDWR